MLNANLSTARGIHAAITPEHAQYYGHGKLLLTGEYFVLDGALSLALPIRFGQSLHVTYKPSFDPKLQWKSYDFDGTCWFDHKFEFWHFDLLDNSENQRALDLQKILRQIRKQNPHFLRDNVEVIVEARLEFPLKWGLGSSSTLIYNLAQWAYVSPFELLFKTLGGSGYDIACAQTNGPILYEKKFDVPKCEAAQFDPSYKDKLLFVYLGKKQSSREGIKYYRERVKNYHDQILKISQLTRAFANAQDIQELEMVIEEHESVISNSLNVPRIQDLYFPDFWGQIKSLGAWGGDFILVTSERSYEETFEYFECRGLDVVIPYTDMISVTPNNTFYRHAPLQ